jgi:hypothetical protein
MSAASPSKRRSGPSVPRSSWGLGWRGRSSATASATRLRSNDPGPEAGPVRAGSNADTTRSPPDACSRPAAAPMPPQRGDVLATSTPSDRVSGSGLSLTRAAGSTSAPARTTSESQLLPHATHPHRHSARTRVPPAASAWPSACQTRAQDEPRSSRRTPTSRLLCPAEASVNQRRDLAPGPRPECGRRLNTGPPAPVEKWSTWRGVGVVRPGR